MTTDRQLTLTLIIAVSLFAIRLFAVSLSWSVDLIRKNHVFEVFTLVSEHLHDEFGNSNCETLARESFEKEGAKTVFTTRKVVYHSLVKVSFLVAKTAMTKRSHS